MDIPEVLQKKIEMVTQRWAFIADVELGTAPAQDPPKSADKALLIHASIPHMAIIADPTDAGSEAAQFVIVYEPKNDRLLSDDVPRLDLGGPVWSHILELIQDSGRERGAQCHNDKSHPCDQYGSGRPGSLLTLAPHRSGRVGSAASGSSTDGFATRRRVPAGPGSQAMATAIPKAYLASSAIRCRDVETGPNLGVLAVFPSTGATCRCPLPSTGSRGLNSPASAVL